MELFSWEKISLKNVGSSICMYKQSLTSKFSQWQHILAKKHYLNGYMCIVVCVSCSFFATAKPPANSTNVIWHHTQLAPRTSLLWWCAILITQTPRDDGWPSIRHIYIYIYKHGELHAVVCSFYFSDRALPNSLP